MAIIHITTEQFDSVLQENSLVLVDFWASWCRYCIVIADILEQLSETFDEKLTVVKVDTDAEPGLAQRFGVEGLPTVILFKNGQAVATKVGAQSLEIYTQLVQKYL